MVMDMRDPGRWYPAARAAAQIHLHVGRTNSGEGARRYPTPRRRRQRVGTAARCGSWRGRWRRSERGPRRTACLRPGHGQEKRAWPVRDTWRARLRWRTAARPVDVAVIDEAHLPGTRTGGYAFTRAIMGCRRAGSYICAATPRWFLWWSGRARVWRRVGGESRTASAPAVLNKPLRRIKDVASGDCLVAFSRSAVHQLKRVELMAGKRACVIYGFAPLRAPGRRELFNDRINSGYDVLIASDAIGMGLQPVHRRVIFTTMRKFDGEQMRLLEPPEVKQIAGRAGRLRHGRHPRHATVGRRACASRSSAAVAAPVVDLTRSPRSRPRWTRSRCTSSSPGSPRRSSRPSPRCAGTRDGAAALLHGHSCDGVLAAATLVEHLPLSLEDHWMFDRRALQTSRTAGKAPRLCRPSPTRVRRRGRERCRDRKAPPARAPETRGELNVLEQAHAAYDLPAALRQLSRSRSTTTRRRCASSPPPSSIRADHPPRRPRRAPRLAGYVGRPSASAAAAAAGG